MYRHLTLCMHCISTAISTAQHTHHTHQCTRTAQVLLLLAAPGGYLQRATAAAGRPELLARFLLLLLDQPRRRGAQMLISGASGAQVPISGVQVPISGASGAEMSIAGAEMRISGVAEVSISGASGARMPISGVTAASGVGACLRRVAMQPEEQAGRLHMNMFICVPRQVYMRGREPARLTKARGVGVGGVAG